MRLIKTVRRGTKSSPLSPLYHKPRQWGTPEGESPTFKIHSHRVRNQTLCRVDGRRSILNHANRRFWPRLLAELPSGESVRLNRAGTVSYEKQRSQHGSRTTYSMNIVGDLPRRTGRSAADRSAALMKHQRPSFLQQAPFNHYCSYIHTNTYEYIPIHTNTWTYEYIPIHTNIPIHTYQYIRIHTYGYIRIHNQYIQPHVYISGLTITLTLT